MFFWKVFVEEAGNSAVAELLKGSGNARFARATYMSVASMHEHYVDKFGILPHAGCVSLYVLMCAKQLIFLCGMLPLVTLKCPAPGPEFLKRASGANVH